MAVSPDAMASSSRPVGEPLRVGAAVLKEWLHDGAEIALLDVREHGQYGEDHLFYAVNAPYSRLERDAPRLVPRPSARVVVYDEDGAQVAPRAAAALAALGYRDVHVLDGGLRAWRGAGLASFAGVNVPSKTFGELAEHALGTPRISPADLAGRQREGDKLVVLDGRPYEEYRKMNIPGSICCPNGELALRVQELVPDSGTTIVVNCAGRTRSIVGAQTLIDLGLPNPVFALENGTQGWYLADLPLEHGSQRRYPDAVAADKLPALRERAQGMAARAGVRSVDPAQASAWLADGGRTTFLCDVRTREEYDAGTLPGARHTPGGQLIQATDQYIGVRGARIVLADAEGVRAPVVAAWLGRMGWDVHVLDGGVSAGIAAAPGISAAPAVAWQAPEVETLAAAGIAAVLRDGAALVDVRPGMAYRKGHIEGARWSIRPRLRELGLAAQTPVVLLAQDGAVGALAALELRSLGVSRVMLNADGPAVWREAGLPVVAGDGAPPDGDCIDYLFFVHDRHSGNKAAARQYLAWETDLVNRIDDRERAAFRLPGAQARAGAGGS